MGVPKYYVENKALFFRHENKVNENKALSYSEALRYMWNNETKYLFTIVSNLQTHYHFKLDFQKVDWHTRGKWLIHGESRKNKDVILPVYEFPLWI